MGNGPRSPDEHLIAGPRVVSSAICRLAADGQSTSDRSRGSLARRRQDSLSSAAAGSSVTPACTADVCSIVLRGAPASERSGGRRRSDGPGFSSADGAPGLGVGGDLVERGGRDPAAAAAG